MLIHAWVTRNTSELFKMITNVLITVFKKPQISFAGFGLFLPTQGISDILICSVDTIISQSVISHYLLTSTKNLVLITPYIREDGSIYLSITKTVYHPIQEARVFVSIEEIEFSALADYNFKSFFNNADEFTEFEISLIEFESKPTINITVSDEKAEITSENASDVAPDAVNEPANSETALESAIVAVSTPEITETVTESTPVAVITTEKPEAKKKASKK